jgi:hypothetical protein
MSRSEVRQHIDSLERLAEGANKPGVEPIKALLLVLRPELQQSTE